jgi:hypothetical protein
MERKQAANDKGRPMIGRPIRMFGARNPTT